MKPTLHVAILRATGHGGRTLLSSLHTGRGALRELFTDVETETRAYRISLGMPFGARHDELPVHGALVLVRVVDGVEDGTHRALRHAHARGVRHVVIVLNTHGVTAEHDADAVERDTRIALFDHRFDGDGAASVRGFESTAILDALDAHLPFFELGQELVPRLMHALRLCELGPQLVDVLDDGDADGRPFPRVLAALMDHGLVTMDAELFVSLTEAGRDALDAPELVASAAEQASRAPPVPYALGDGFGGRLAARRDFDERSIMRFGDRGPVDLALSRLLRALPLSTRAQDALAALRAAVPDDYVAAWREVASAPDVMKAFFEIEALATHAWLFADVADAWQTLAPFADWLRAATGRVFVMVEEQPVYDDW